MIIDLSNKKSLEISKSKYDICIVGSGPAGLTIANELANSNLRVCVLESGKNKKAKYADSLRKVASTGIQIREDSRERIFGGTSHTWGGGSSIFNKDNLEEKYYLPNSGWPISYDELLNYYDLASKRYDFPDLNLFLNESENFNTPTDLDIDNLKAGLNFQWKDIKEKLFIVNNNPQRFAKKFSGIFEQDNVDLYLNATLTMEMAPNKDKIFAKFLKLIWNITIHLPSVLIYIFYKLVPNTSPMIHKIHLMQFMEMAPNKENKISLDENGIPKVQHYIKDIDKISMVELNNILKREIEDLNIGKVEISFDKDDIWQTMQDASHHIGTTRMGNDSKSSVIDSNSKVHNIENLYIAGSSVFPTSGCVNPTYTIVALSIRLAEHIKNNIKNSYDKNYHDHDNSYSRPIMMIGSGRRFNNDILPVLGLLENKYYINKIFSRRDNIIFSKNKHKIKTKTYSVSNIEKLNEKNISNTKYIYISVLHEQVESILEKLSQYDCSNIELIVDTPVIKKFKEYFIFKKVHIAEDSVFLPWIDLLKNQKIKSIYFDKSVYGFHGISLIKKINKNQKQSHIYGFRFLNKTFLNFKNSKMKVKILEPRDYSKGKIFIDDEEYPIKLFNSNNKIILKFKEKEVSLNEAEKSLFGELKEGNQDTIINRMHDLKRVGLYRLLNSIYDTGNSWSLDDGINDYKIDRDLHRKHFTN